MIPHCARPQTESLLRRGFQATIFPNSTHFTLHTVRLDLSVRNLQTHQIPSRSNIGSCPSWWGCSCKIYLGFFNFGINNGDNVWSWRGWPVPFPHFIRLKLQHLSAFSRYYVDQCQNWGSLVKYPPVVKVISRKLEKFQESCRRQQRQNMNDFRFWGGTV